MKKEEKTKSVKAKQRIEEVVELSKKYKIVKEKSTGSEGALYALGYWYGKIALAFPGPIWKLYRKTWLAGWIQISTTNRNSVVTQWKKEYFKNEG